LALAGAIAGALLVFVFLWSDPLIKAEQARVLREAVTEVLKGPDRFESVFIVDGELTTQVPAGVDTLDLEKVFLGYDAAGNPVGFALVHERFGFQDLITVIFGYDPEAKQVLGMKVLDHSETPGLGNKIEEMPFVGEFNGVDAPIEGVKPDRNTGASNQVDMITSVTISSRAVIRTINERIEQLGDLLEAYEIPPTTAGADPPSTSGGGVDR
jgi:electron transport complex protein RnfG